MKNLWSDGDARAAIAGLLDAIDTSAVEVPRAERHRPESPVGELTGASLAAAIGALLPEEARKALGAGIPFPQRLGKPSEYGQLACSIISNAYLNGETIRLDGALRMPPR